MARPRRPSPTDNRLAQFLIESGYRPLALAGRAVKAFGVKPVAAFLLGAATLYVVALFQPLPGLPTAPAGPPAATEILLKGEVETLDGEPLDEFRLGVLRGPLEGPFQGSFAVKARADDQYNLIVLPPDSLHPIKFYGSRIATPDPQNAGIHLLEGKLSSFPTNLGRVQGMVLDLNGRAVAGLAEIEDPALTYPLRKKIGPDGFFEIKDIPLGHATLTIRSESEEVLRRDVISVDIGGVTDVHYDNIEP